MVVIKTVPCNTLICVVGTGPSIIDVKLEIKTAGNTAQDMN
jgi:hypothetical protein